MEVDTREGDAMEVDSEVNPPVNRSRVKWKDYPTKFNHKVTPPELKAKNNQKVKLIVEKKNILPENYIKIADNYARILSTNSALRPDRTKAQYLTMAKLIRGRIDKKYLEKLHKTLEEYEKHIGPKLRKKNRDNVTDSTVHLGAWEVYSTQTRKTAETEDPAAEIFLDANVDFFEEIDRIFQYNFRNWFDLYVLANTDGKDFRTPCKSFRTLAINFRGFSDYHVDWDDYEDGFALIVPLGDFDGGELALPDLGYALAAKEGDVIILNSRRLIHGNLPITRGARQSMVFFSHRPPFANRKAPGKK